MKKILKWFLVVIITAIISALIGYYIGKGLEIVHTKPSLEIVMPQTYEDDGSFKITLVNGGVRLNNVQVDIKSCYMQDKWKHYPIDDLPPNKELHLKFEDELTLNKSKIIDCKEKPLECWQDRTIILNVYRNITSGEFLSPSIEDDFYMCGYCYWNISVTSKQENFSFYKKMFLPTKLIIKGEPLLQIDEIQLDSPEIVFYSEIRFTFFGPKELEIEGEYD